MIMDSRTVLYKLKEYKSPKSKITQLIKKNELVQIRRGLFETDPSAPPYALLSAVYGPSYLSFEYALYWYNIIHERVSVITGAVFGKNKIKEFQTPFGYYLYQPVPKAVYPYDVGIFTENGYSWQMASPEKALCDTLYKAPPLKNVSELQSMLFDSLGMEERVLRSLKRNDIRFLAPRYGRKNTMLLLQFLEGA
ncbi:hypothetical protein HRQ91_02010 [Treponema parvum]|uniref:Transcriptional regulator, AbiEi antitoxin, Type IV TA system n=1 Tax=Treponema parvum TaxID=138851 RepID=A0A975F2R7_9SPIR|nr:hypothetical protein [Treponema parvum]QTQ13327.1 hypothetical protein HRQ91_02010 [Treponema parvum]